MLTGKIILYLSYVLFGIFIVFIYPWLHLIAIQDGKKDIPYGNQNQTWDKDWFLKFGIVLLVASSALLPLHFVIASVIIAWLLSYRDQQWRNSRVAIFIGLIASSFLAFWMHNDHNRLSLSPTESLQFFSITLLGYFSLVSVKLAPINTRVHAIYKSLIYGLFIALAFYFSFDARINLAIDSFYQWHHWSAYLGQAQLIASGAIPLNDIPVQYGSGPILLSAIGCKLNCWLSFYWIAAGSSFLLTLVIGFLCLRLSKAKSALQISTVLIIALLTSLFWPPYQNEILSITTFPSITGLRFFPSLLMLCSIFIYLKSPKVFLSPNRPAFYLFALVWGLCLAWSPDAGIQASVVWFPFYFWARIFQEPHTFTRHLVVRVIIELVMSSIAALCLLAMLFYCYFGEWPNLAHYLIYLQALPGVPEKVNSNGLIWFAITIAILWVCFARSTITLRSDKLIWLSGLLAYANFTYFLSHNHDSVMADLLPYFVLVICGIYGAAPSPLFRKITSILLAAIIGWSSLMVGWPKIIESLKTNSQGNLITLLVSSPKKLMSQFNLENSDPFSVAPRSRDASLKSANLNSSIKYLHTHFSEPIEIFDQWLLIDSGETSTPWNAFHGPVTSLVLPQTKQKYFLERFSKKFPRSGWVLYDKDFAMDNSLKLYDSAYTRTKEIDFLYYRAIHYVPK